ncbi:radical SAM protein [Rhizobium leguminosarum]|uniref:radical SAM protein n=1 Tax=Rhizobium leguminosarum TaxID=384 RepID=UPI001C901B08|nr:radical SAM protein [Rhizobium leguminosarum]MBY2998409.1 radical SAM protein [Rhizobium leguminosarum]
MHLAEMLALRSVACAGLFVSVTRRCPLSCAHCSTRSTPFSEEQDSTSLLKFLGSMSSADRPEFILLTGGEALMRPDLVSSISAIAHAMGSKVSLISGMFFAKNGLLPDSLAHAIAGIDHFTASLDVFHEQEVPRAAVFAVLEKLIEGGKDVSLHIVGSGPDDPYIIDVTADINRTFGNSVPALVGKIHPVGRAADWMAQTQSTEPRLEIDPTPCSMAAWPVITFDGTIVACCSQEVVDGDAPEHLRIGDVRANDWVHIRKRHVTAGIPKALRVFGPEYLAAQFGGQSDKCLGYCETCWRLSDDPKVASRIESFGSRFTMDLVESHVSKILGQMPLQGIMPEYAHLAYVGAPTA